MIFSLSGITLTLALSQRERDAFSTPLHTYTANQAVK